MGSMQIGIRIQTGHQRISLVNIYGVCKGFRS